MSKHREDAKQEAPERAPKAPEPSPRPALVLIHGGPRLTPEQQALVLEAARFVNFAITKRRPEATQALRAELRAAIRVRVTEAARTYDRSRGSFVNYVRSMVFGAIDDYFDEVEWQETVARAGRMAGRQWMAEQSHHIDWDELEARTPEAREGQAVELASHLLASMVTGEAYDFEDPERDLIEQIDRRRYIEAMQGAQTRMTKRQRRILTLRFVEQRGLEEIAAELGIDKRSVVRNVGRALDLLMAELAEAGFTEMS